LLVLDLNYLSNYCST